MWNARADSRLDRGPRNTLSGATLQMAVQNRSSAEVAGFRRLPISQGLRMAAFLTFTLSPDNLHLSILNRVLHNTHYWRGTVELRPIRKSTR